MTSTMTLPGKIKRRNILATLIAIQKADNVDRAEYQRLRLEVRELKEREMK